MVGWAAAFAQRFLAVEPYVGGVQPVLGLALPLHMERGTHHLLGHDTRRRDFVLLWAGQRAASTACAARTSNAVDAAGLDSRPLPLTLPRQVCPGRLGSLRRPGGESLRSAPVLARAPGAPPSQPPRYLRRRSTEQDRYDRPSRPWQGSDRRHRRDHPHDQQQGFPFALEDGQPAVAGEACLQQTLVAVGHQQQQLHGSAGAAVAMVPSPTAA